MSILGIGAINLDIIFRFKKGDILEEIHPNEEEEIVRSEKEWWDYFCKYVIDRDIYCCGGGSSANTICAIASLDSNVETSFLGIRGKDIAYDIICNDKSWELIDHKEYFNIYHELKSTGLCLSYIFSDDTRRLAVLPRANEGFNADLIDLDKFDKFKWIHISPFVITDYKEDKCNNQIVKLLDKIAKSRFENKPIISLDPGTFLSKDALTQLAQRMIEHCHYLFLKESELWSLGGIPTKSPLRKKEKSEIAAKNIFKSAKSCLNIIVEHIKKGEGGFTIYSNLDLQLKNQKSWYFHYDFPKRPLKKHKIQDDTGLGDVFNAAFIYGKLTDKDNQFISVLAKNLTDIKRTTMGRRGYDQFAGVKLKIINEYEKFKAGK